jgi:hypothetical protein
MVHFKHLFEKIMIGNTEKGFTDYITANDLDIQLVDKKYT